MAYQVIARKYRPQRFSDVVGQEHVTQTLSRAIEQKRIAHAYLFCGPRGTGKTTIARIFAKCLNCTGGPKVEFDDQDTRCREIAEGRSLDVFEIDGASNNGVEQVRELRETCKYAPASARFKIYIIDEVHMLSTAAFNALLKTLEEPPEHVKFLFATTDPEKVLPTILSRCQRFDLRRIPAALIAGHLAQIAKQEKVTIAPAALYAIARGAEGAMRDAESALDQLISFCGDSIEEADVLSMFGLAAQNQVMELARAVLAGEIESALRQLNELATHGKDLGRLLSDLLNHFRNLLIFQVSSGDLSMLEASEAEAAALAAQSKTVSREGLTRIMEVFADTEMRLRDAASKKILVEVALLKAIEARQAVSIEAVLKQLHDLGEGKGGEMATLPVRSSVSKTVSGPLRAESSALAAGAPVSATDTGPTSQREPLDRLQNGDPHPGPLPLGRGEGESSPSSGVAHAANRSVIQEAPAAAGASPSHADLQVLWGHLIEAVGRVSVFTRSYLLEAHPVSFAKKLLTIGFDPQFEDHIGLVDNPRNHALLQTKLAELGYTHAQIKFIKAEAPAGNLTPAPEIPPSTAAAAPAPPSPALPSRKSTAPAPAKEKPVSVPFSKDDFKSDPLIQKALEMFKGQIVEVRA